MFWSQSLRMSLQRLLGVLKGKNKFKNKVWNPKALALIFRETRKKNNQMIFTWIGWMLLWFNFKPFWLVSLCGGWDLFSALACCHPHVKCCSKCSGTWFYFWYPQNHEELFSWLHLMESNKTQGRGGWWIMDCTKGDVARDKPYWNNSWAAWQRNGHVSVQNRKKMMDSFHIASQVMATWAEQWHLLFGPWWNSDLSQDSECIADLHRYPPHLSKMAPALAQQSSQRARSGCAQLHYRLNRWRHHVENGRSIYLSGSPGDMVHGWCFTS